MIGEYDSSGYPINLYVYAPGSDVPLARFSGTNQLNDMVYLRADERGSIMLETDGASILESHQYDAYGVPLESSDSLFRYTGQIQLKGTELYHYKVRAYHPELGRFLQTDPIGYDDGMNMYELPNRTSMCSLRHTAHSPGWPLDRPTPVSPSPVHKKTPPAGLAGFKGRSRFGGS